MIVDKENKGLSDNSMARRAMKQYVITLILLLSTLAPTVSGWNIEDEFEPTNHLSDYSPAVQRAFDRCAELGNHEGDWLVVSEQKMGSPAPLLPNAWLVESNDLEIQRWLDEDRIEIACPDIGRDQELKLIPNDPQFGDQWHLRNTGQSGGVSGEDANLTGVWDSYLGTGVEIAIIDDGLEWTHPDLSTNYDSVNDYDYCNSDNDPTPVNSNYDHGTSSAGVAAATGNNSVGVSGSAPEATLAGFTLIEVCSSPDSMEANALTHEDQIMDIYSNSWGPFDNGEILAGPGPLLTAGFESNVANGRGGLGNIITWAAGNGLANDDDANKDGYANAIETIAVTAVSHMGRQSWYAEPGANILIAAHSSGDSEGITTVDTNNGYTDNFGGTSSATPLVSGIIALMLEANPTLTWRDVQHILVHSGNKNDPLDSSWNTNGAGHDVSHKYGYGSIDAGLAISHSENWTTVSPALNISSGVQSIAQAIPDGIGSAVTDTVTVPEILKIEHVQVTVDISHTYRGDLEIILTSPSGTESVLAQEHSDSGNDYNGWTFMTVHNWDENSQGDWTISVEDLDGGQSGTFDEWELIIHGTEFDPDSDIDGLTDSNETNVHLTDPFDNDTDDDMLEDGAEVNVYGTDPLNVDTDNDGLFDGIEVLVNGTDPLDNDTDDDGLSDGAEVNTYGTNPLVPDPDLDSDTWYWFQDCDDTNPDIHPGANETLNGVDDNCDLNIDDGFNNTDFDNDGLSDWPEFYIIGTDWQDPDTDGDGLWDGDEILTHGTNPLQWDNDTDADTWYWFEDCNDTNPLINPGISEVLDNIDNDCNDGIDEDFIYTDQDGDGLKDLVEFNQLGTDPWDPDTDDDGLTDYEEVFVTHTDPLIPDLDEDGDGFRWFEECDDNNSALHPDATEVWDGIDQNCNGTIDEGVDLSAYIISSPSTNTLLLNATQDILGLGLVINLDPTNATRLDLNVSWYRDGNLIALDVFSIQEGPYECESDTLQGFAADLCAMSNTVGPWNYSVIIADARYELEISWDVSYFVWHPPEQIPDDSNDGSDSNNEGLNETKSEDGGGLQILENPEQLIIIVGSIVALLLIVLLFSRRKGKKSQPAPPPQWNWN
ncbi:MAG: S8 family serine peptidase [Candidatus Thermoplasmatota archaeon]|nr:S8 family serine peptidase [Candidatus Thermoplasmatota archaeon]